MIAARCDACVLAPLTALRAGLSNTKLFQKSFGVTANETHLSAFQDPPQSHARISRAPEDAGRAGGSTSTASQGSHAPRRVTSGLRLPRAARIRDEVILRALQRAGRVRGHWFVAAALANGLDESRLAVRVAKRVMKSAVARNRIRRCVREVFRQLRPGLAPSDFLVSLVQPYRNRSLQAARQDIERLLVQAASR